MTHFCPPSGLKGSVCQTSSAMCGRIGAMTEARLMSIVWSTVWQERRRKSSELEIYNLGRGGAG